MRPWHLLIALLLIPVWTAPLAAAQQSEAETALYERVKELNTDLQTRLSAESGLKAAVEKSSWGDAKANAALRDNYLAIANLYKSLGETTQKAYWITNDERQRVSYEKCVTNAALYEKNAKAVDENARIKADNDRAAGESALRKGVNERMGRLDKALTGANSAPLSETEKQGLRADLAWLRASRAKLDEQGRADLDAFLKSAGPALETRLR